MSLKTARCCPFSKEASGHVKKAGILIIGDEILKGQVLDTNSHFICKELYSYGVKVVRIAVISDSIDEISKEVKKFSSRYDYVITTGGIGPTHDDMTYAGVAKAFGESVTIHDDMAVMVNKWLAHRGYDQDVLKRMAELPTSAKLLFDVNRPMAGFPIVIVKNVYVFPGVPQFVEKMFPRLASIFRSELVTFHSREIYVAKDEMAITTQINKAVDKFKDTVTFGSYPVYNNLYYSTRLTMESLSADYVQKANDYLVGLMPVNTVVKFDKNAVTNSSANVYAIVDDTNHKLHQVVSKAVKVIEEALEKFELECLCICFNGGKDCTALLHLFHAVVQKKFPKTNIKIQSLYIKGDNPFEEMETFIEQTSKSYVLKIWTYDAPIKNGLTTALMEHKQLKGVLMGTRRSDPSGEKLGYFQMTDAGWPQIMRISPMLDWSFSDVWTFLRSLTLPYCPLYDRGNPAKTPMVTPTAYPKKLELYEVKINNKYRKYFDYVHHVDINKVVVTCKVTNNVPDGGCRQLTITEGNYTNLSRHLKSIHSIDLKEDITPVKETNQRNFYGNSADKQLAFDEIVLELFADGLPLSIVEKKSVKRLVNLLDPQINLKCRQTYTKNLSKTALKIKPEIAKQLESVNSTGAHFEIDIWTNRRASSVIGVKAHFINEDWVYQIRTVALAEFNVVHTAENIKSKFIDIIQKLNFPLSKVGAIISDNASNMKRAFNMFGIIEKYTPQLIDDVDDFFSNEVYDYEPESSTNDYNNSNFDEDESDEETNAQGADICYKTLGWSPCLAHTVQLVVNSSIKKSKPVNEVVKKVCNTVHVFKKSPKAMAAYRKEVKDACTCSVKTTHEMIKPNTTRWNSTFFALERFCKEDVFAVVRDMIRRLNEEGKSRSKAFPAPLTASNLKEIEEICELLRPLQTLTSQLQSDGLTCNIATVGIVKAFMGVQAVKCERFKAFQTNILMEMKVRFEPALRNKWFILGSVLDPRQKMKLFGRAFSDTSNLSLSLPSTTDVELLMEDELRRLESDGNLPQVSQSKPKPQEKLEDSSGLFSFLNEIPDDVASPSVMGDFRHYIEQATVSTTESPLLYWKANSARYPKLAKLARTIMAVPASSGSVERLFSVAGDISRARRAKIEISRIEEIVLLREHNDSV